MKEKKCMFKEIPLDSCVKKRRKKKTYEINYEMKFSSNAIIYVILSFVCDS